MVLPSGRYRGAAAAFLARQQTDVAEQAVTNGVVNAAWAGSLTLRTSPGGATIGTMYTGPFNGISKF
ncbi:hypothetical protein [Sorangium sp. So ce233]|uniref:hypothetical protein n=1 Tax=Sorangium sp. So ce233 TaxID=3133290 RepID=UPI003F6318B2